MTDNEIIEAIATKVMGWREDYRCPRDGAFAVLENGTHMMRHFNPLTNPADSKLVREKLAERFATLILRRDLTQFTCRLGVLGNVRPVFGANADTEERAVALCALKSVGIEVA